MKSTYKTLESIEEALLAFGTFLNDSRQALHEELDHFMPTKALYFQALKCHLRIYSKNSLPPLKDR
jgi:hypothetical protein